MRLDRVAPEEERMGATPSPHSTRKESVFPTSSTLREEHDITGYLQGRFETEEMKQKTKRF